MAFSVIDPGLLAMLGDVGFPSRGTVQKQALTSDGVQRDDVYTDLPGHADIPCRKSPLLMARASQGQQVRTTISVSDVQLEQCLLAGFYPQIAPDEGEEPFRILIDALPYDILGAEYDGERRLTRLLIQRVI